MVDLPEPDGPSSATISPGTIDQVGRRDDLDAVLARLRVVLLDLFGANDGLGRLCHRSIQRAKYLKYRQPFSGLAQPQVHMWRHIFTSLMQAKPGGSPGSVRVPDHSIECMRCLFAGR